MSQPTTIDPNDFDCDPDNTNDTANTQPDPTPTPTPTPAPVPRPKRKMPPSEARNSANRRNSQLSTGPSPHGINVSKYNNLVHGMRAETLIVMDGENEAELRERVESW